MTRKMSLFDLMPLPEGVEVSPINTVDIWEDNMEIDRPYMSGNHSQERMLIAFQHRIDQLGTVERALIPSYEAEAPERSQVGLRVNLPETYLEAIDDIAAEINSTRSDVVRQILGKAFGFEGPTPKRNRRLKDRK
jgi:hypothetical protein